MQSDVKSRQAFVEMALISFPSTNGKNQIDVYLRKRGVPIGEQAQELMSSLGGEQET